LPTSVVNPVQLPQVVDNADGWSLFTALGQATVAVADGNDNNNDNFIDELVTVIYY